MAEYGIILDIVTNYIEKKEIPLTEVYHIDGAAAKVCPDILL